MKIKKAAVAGTLESSDAMVSVEPWENGIEFDLNSTVIQQYGDQIKSVVMETLNRLGVEHVRIIIVDKGALDCTIKARVECAIFRSAGQSDNFPWGGAVRP